MTICTTVTNDAITTMKAGMRTLSGTMPLMAEMAAFEKMSTSMVASPIDMPVMAEDVVPSVGHMPKMSTKVGLRCQMPESIV